MTRRTPGDVVPASVSLGEVVPPEDPEDWSRPLTWVVAAGMLAGPLAGIAWFTWAAPVAAHQAQAGTFLVAAALAGGAAATGSTQRGAPRAWMATIGAALFGALLLVVIGVAAAGERQLGITAPTVSHAVAAGGAGLAGAAAAALPAAALASLRSRVMRAVPSVLAGAVVAIAAVALIN